MKIRFSNLQKTFDSSALSQEKKRQDFGQEITKERQRAIEDWYKYGGTIFLDWAKRYYRTHEGQSLTWNDPFLEEFFLICGNPWVERLIVEKPAQVGYTESLIAFAAFFLGYLRLPLGFGFEERNKLNEMSGKRIQPAFDNCEPLRKLSSQKAKITDRADLNSRQSISVGGVPLNLFYAGVKSNKPGYQTPSRVRSTTSYGIIADEFGLWPPDMLDAAIARTARSELPTQIIRAGSTPGHEGGTVDREIKKGKYLFEWQVQCPHCQKLQFLDAFGNLFKAKEFCENEVTEERFIDLQGRPLDWYYTDDRSIDTKIATSYLGCIRCGNDLGTCLSNGSFVCVYNNLKLTDFCNQLLKEQRAESKNVCLRLPCLATKVFNVPKRIRFQIETENPEDAIQQFLGKAVSLGGGKINLSKLIACTEQKFPEPDKKPDLIVMGLDQGHYSNQVALVQYWYWGIGADKEKTWRNATKRTMWYGEIPRIENILDFVKQWDIDVVGMDSEPEFNSAVDFALRYPPSGSISPEKGKIFLFDQVYLKGEQFRRTVRKVKNTGGKKDLSVPVFLIDRTCFLDATRDRIYRALHYLPEVKFEPESKNLLYHFLTSERIAHDGKWIAPPGAPDHFHHADSFAEAVALIQFYEQENKFVYGTLAQI